MPAKNAYTTLIRCNHENWKFNNNTLKLGYNELGTLIKIVNL